MMKKTKSILPRIWWLGRGTATVMGVAAMLASTALAGTGIGARFDLGKTNTVGALKAGARDPRAYPIQLAAHPRDHRLCPPVADDVDCGLGAGLIGMIPKR